MQLKMGSQCLRTSVALAPSLAPRLGSRNNARSVHGRQANLWVCRHFDKRGNRNTTVKRIKSSRHEMAVDIAIEDTRLKEKRPGILKDVSTDGDSAFLIPFKAGSCKNYGPRLASYQSLVNKAEFKWQTTGRLGRCA